MKKEEKGERRRQRGISQGLSFNSTGGGESLPNGGDGVSPFNSVRSRSTTSRRHCEYCSTVRGTKQT